MVWADTFKLSIKAISRRAFAIPIALLFFLPPLLAAPNPDSQWDNLKQLTKKTSFVFVNAEHNCVAGALNTVTDDAVTVKLKDGRTVKVNRPDLLRVSLGEYASGVLYSRRSSWYDVTSLASARILRILGGHPRLVIIERSGIKHEGKLIRASETSVVLETQRKQLAIPRSEVAKVFYINRKPLSSSASYADDELAFLKVFDPELWPKLIGLQGSIRVQIFDNTIAQQETPIVCNQNPWEWAPNQPGLDVTQH